jgi:zinc transporter 1/2/3
LKVGIFTPIHPHASAKRFLPSPTGLALGSRLGQLIFPPGKGWKRYVMAIVYGVGAFPVLAARRMARNADLNNDRQVITSIGIGIGIGVHHAYNPNSPAALLSIGILQSISAGILLYSGIGQYALGEMGQDTSIADGTSTTVELLVHDFMHGALAHAGKWKVAAAAAAMTAGMICMSVLGVWA